MNRLVIIGNGFDLAHGLPTSYRDFIDDFWKNFKDNYKSVEYQDIVITHEHYNGYLSNKPFENFNDFKTNLLEYCVDNRHSFNERMFVASNSSNVIFQFRNDFFKEINIKNSENWVDIENEYHKSLKKIVSESLAGSSQNTVDLEELILRKKIKVKRLNDEFEQIKNLLKKYLIDSVENVFDFSENDNDWTKFYHVLKPISIENNESNLLEEFNNRIDKSEIRNFFNAQKREIDTYNKKTLCLNFNYTTTIYKYFDNFKKGGVNFDNIHIHGELLNDKNEINFGFGDEMDDSYKAIENINDNEYLRNFKSFQYLQNNNYDNLLSYIDSEKYQVIILGHSCGLSDRTLLNTIFEHENCRSIKVYYHKKEDGSDNYTDIIQNISRHFNKKKLMREKIVNKTLCLALPQIQLAKYKMLKGLKTRVY